MKQNLILFWSAIAFLSGTTANAQTTGTLTDSRDGQVYKTITLNGKSWMAQNLNYATDKGSCCYNDQKDFCYKYGKLYTWTQTDIACPVDWHVPTGGEWQSLIDYFGGDESAGTKLLKGGSSGFNASLGGDRGKSGSFENIGAGGYYWSSTPASDNEVYCRNFYSGGAKVIRFENIRESSFSVRCVKD